MTTLPPFANEPVLELRRVTERSKLAVALGELVAGMAYLVRRLLENTSNESFLGDQQRGVPIEELLAAP